jgi:hypothetical protein
MKYKLLIDSTRGRAGTFVDLHEGEGETIAILTRNKIIGEPEPEGDDAQDSQKVDEPKVTKVTSPAEVKTRGRPKNASNAAK